jgi:hypothetical protein
MTDNTRTPVSLEMIDAVLAHFNFSSYAESHAWERDEYFLIRIVRELKADIDRSLPALQPGAEIECGWDRLTSEEREYSSKFFYHQHESLFLPLMREGWSVRRIHREVVAMLRALIALDPERLSEFDVVVPSEEVAKVDQGSASAADLAASEIQRLARTRVDGHMLRYGMYLGLAMALEGNTDHGDLANLARQLADEVGANDPLERPAYRMDARSKEFLRELRAQRDAKENQ